MAKVQEVTNLNTASDKKAQEQSDTHTATDCTGCATERLELYRVVVDGITANEARRQQMMTVYVSLMVAGFAAMGSIETLDPLFVVIPALPLSVVWYASLRYFRALATAKFKVIAHLEKGFSVKPFEMEWKSMCHPKVGLSVLEMTLPVVIMLACVVFLILRYATWSQ